MMDSDGDEAELLLVSSLFLLSEANLVATLIETKRKRAVNVPEIREKNGRRLYDRPIYTQSTWWIMLEKGDCKILGHAHNKLFRRRFSIPFSMFKDITEEAREWIGRNGKRLGDRTTDCVGLSGVPLELKVLGALRMSAKGCSFDAIAELSGMSISTMQAFYHDFWEKFVDVFRDRWIIYPTNALEAADNLAVYGRLGFPGAIGSVDCTHVYWGRCPALFQNTFSGKEKKPTVAYEVTVNHSCRVLYISAEHPGSRNDKTIVKTDKLVMDLKDKKILQDVEYNLFKADGSIVSVRGAYLITDNGYAKWRIMQCPIKFSINENELRWSTRLESVRKDVECFFGRLKARFRILHMRILFQQQYKVDNVFISSSILHNMNLVHDELDIAWKNPLNWETAEDEDDSDLREGRERLRMRGRLVNPDAMVEAVDAINPRNVVVENDDDFADASYYDFRKMLIDHYIYCSSQDTVEWI